jgi:DNA-directed RNA polymerase specialized sigma24 family protein
MPQALRSGDMKKKQSVRRERFENNTFPHLDALWMTALWLTMRDSLAEKLVLKTMTRAYLEWQDSGDLVNNKARLFRILTREFFSSGKRRHQWHQPGKYLSENIRTTTSSERRFPQDATSAIEPSHLPLLTGVSDVPVKGAIARLRPRSRLIMILLFRERFSYADIAFITDLSRNSVRTILTRLRAVITSYVLANAHFLEERTGGQGAFLANNAGSDRDHQSVYLNLPFIHAQESPAASTSESWEE